MQKKVVLVLFLLLLCILIGIPSSNIQNNKSLDISEYSLNFPLQALTNSFGLSVCDSSLRQSQSKSRQYRKIKNGIKIFNKRFKKYLKNEAENHSALAELLLSNSEETYNNLRAKKFCILPFQIPSSYLLEENIDQFNIANLKEETIYCSAKNISGGFDEPNQFYPFVNNINIYLNELKQSKTIGNLASQIKRIKKKLSALPENSRNRPRLRKKLRTLVLERQSLLSFKKYALIISDIYKEVCQQTSSNPEAPESEPEPEVSPSPNPSVGGDILPSPSPLPSAVTIRSFEAESGDIDEPFSISAGIVSQNTKNLSDPKAGGLATYDFHAPKSGNYVIKAHVKALHGGANSFFVNIGSDPTSKMVWSIDPLTSGSTPQERTVSWRGDGTPEFPGEYPKIFYLESGNHQIFFRGREPGTGLDKIRIVYLGTDVAPSPSIAPSASPSTSASPSASASISPSMSPLASPSATAPSNPSDECEMRIDEQVTACSCFHVDIQNAIKLAEDGDTVFVPKGNCTWTSGINISKAIALRGAGISNTVITDNVNGGRILSLSTVANKRYEVSGFTFKDGPARATGSAINVDGQGKKIVFHDIKLDNLDKGYLQQFRWGGGTTGVVYNSEFISDDYIFMVENGEEWKGVSDPGGKMGSNSWATDTNFGSEEFLFIEDNIFTVPSPGTNQILRVTDGSRGGRFVMRYNELTDSLIAWHGTDSSGFQRGFRAAEIYNNIFTESSSAVDKLLQVRSGSVLFHNNTILKGYPNLSTLNVYRATSKESGKYGGGNGLADSTDGNQYDDVDLSDGAGTPGGAGDGVFEDGIADSQGRFHVIDSSKSWKPNQWIGYTLINKVTGHFSSIRSNTATTITTDSLINHGPGYSTLAGQGYEIRRVKNILDQPGMGKGDLIFVQGKSPYDALPAGWPNQELEPCYEWDNNWPGEDVDWGTAYVHIKEGDHYLNDTPKPGYTPFTYPHPLRQSR